MNIILFGTPEFAVIILKALITADMLPVAVVTTPDKPSRRGQHMQSPPIKILAIEEGIPILQPEKLDSGFRFQVSGFKPDVFVIAAYGKILPQVLLEIPTHGTINAHPSLLPRHRGPSPIQQTILDGDEVAGVTLMLTDEKMDHGPILAQREWKILNPKSQFPKKSQIPISKTTYMELHNILAKLGGDLLVETLPKYIAGNITPREQDHSQATYTKLLTKEDGHIDWAQSAEKIDRMVRALNPWPGTWSYLSVIPSLTRNPEAQENGSRIKTSLTGQVQDDKLKRIKILAGHPTSESSSAPPGTLIKTKSGQLTASTGDVLYVIEKLQMEGKKETLGQASSHSIRGSMFS